MGGFDKFFRSRLHMIFSSSKEGGPRHDSGKGQMQEITYTTHQQLSRVRNLPGYRFRLFDESFPAYNTADAEDFLACGRQVLFASVELADDRLLLAKAEGEGRTVALYVDRDYYEVSLWDEDGHHHTDGWQWPFQVRGHSMEDLEYFMAQHLLGG
jgi:hypothetical protein